MPDKRDKDDSWDRYWEHGFLTSCSSAFDANYEGAIKQAWTQFLGAVPAGGRVLDICTGNGAIAMIANDVSRDRGLDLKIHGIDSAAIRPQETVRTDRHLLEGIHFHPDTPAETTPFPDAHFQAITGQYAFEYTDEDACIKEMARIAAPACRLLFIIHHADSVVMQTTREEIRNGAIIFDETRIFERARDIIEIVGPATLPVQRRALASDPSAEKARQALNAAAERLSEALQTSAHPELLQMAMNRVAQAYRSVDTEGMDTALQQLADGQRDMTANMGRLRDLMAAARNEDQIGRICDVLTINGFVPLEPFPIRHDEHRLMGWRVQATRRPD